jgi:hypothetical protein
VDTDVRLRRLAATARHQPSPGWRVSEGWWTAQGSNLRPPRCERGALPAELAAHPWGSLSVQPDKNFDSSMQLGIPQRPERCRPCSAPPPRPCPPTPSSVFSDHSSTPCWNPGSPSSRRRETHPSSWLDSHAIRPMCGTGTRFAYAIGIRRRSRGSRRVPQSLHHEIVNRVAGLNGRVSCGTGSTAICLGGTNTQSPLTTARSTSGACGAATAPTAGRSIPGRSGCSRPLSAPDGR